MPILKLRGLGQFGIISDIDPYDLPPMAFSSGVNVRFSGEHVERGPIIRSCRALAASSPRTVFTRVTATGEDVFVGYLNGSVALITPSNETDQSISGYSPSSTEEVFTSTTLARVEYVNRSDRVPWAYTPTGTQFVPLANWNSGWTCKALRTYNAALIAMNLTKSGIDYPTTINTSSFPTDGSVPATWDHETPGSNAYQNILSEMRGPIMDGLQLNDSFFIYGQFDVFEMRATGDEAIYVVEPRFRDRGVLNTNCVVEVDSVHYVLGQTDIYKHDGITPKSIIDEKVRNFIFNNLVRGKSHLTFVDYDPNLKEVRFNYVSLDPLCAFPTSAADGCNRCAAFNLVNGTWTFYDLPYVFGSTLASFPQSQTWDQLSGSWDTQGGSWNSLIDPTRRGVLMVGPTVASRGLVAKVYAHDLYTGGVFGFDVDVNATTPVYLERTGIDMDDVPPYYLTGYKLVRKIVPQARLGADAEPFEVAFGAGGGFNEEPEWQDYQTYDGVDYTKVDFNDGGRFVSFRMRHADYRGFVLTGLDLDVVKLSDRP